MSVKQLNTLALLLSLLATSFCYSIQASAAERKNPVSDLHNGEAIYYFFLEDPLKALTQLAIKDKKPYLNKTASTEKNLDDLLLETALKLDFQMTLSAKALLENKNVSEEIKHRDKLWLYLAQGFYQKQLFAMAENSLEKIAATDKLKQKNIYYFLKLQLALKQTQTNEKQLNIFDALLANIDNKSIYFSYAANNLAIAYYQVKNVTKATHLLDQAIETTNHINNQEAQQLQQHLLIAAAFMHFYQNDDDSAEQYFKKLSINSLFADQALLGFGQLAAEKNKPSLALALWKQAAEYPIASKSKIKSLNNMALLLETKEQHQQALTQFEKVDQLCAQQLLQLDDIKQRNNDNKLLTPILQFHEFHKQNSTAYREEEQAQRFDQDLKNNEFLLQLINNEAYLSLLQQHQDLEKVKQQLLQWQQDIPLYQDIVSSKKQAFSNKQAWAQQQDFSHQTTAFNNEVKHFSKLIENIETNKDSLALLTSAQKSLWDKVISSEHTLSLIQDDPFYQDYQQQLRRVKGALIWQAAEQYPTQLWQSKKQLQALKAALHSNNQQQQVFTLAMNNQSRYQIFEQQLQHKSQQLNQLLSNIDSLQQQTLQALHQAFNQQWTLERQHILDLQKSSRIAIARVSEHFMQVDYE